MTVTLVLGPSGHSARVRILPGEHTIGRRATEAAIVPAEDKSIRRADGAGGAESAAATPSAALRFRPLSRSARSRKHGVFRVTAFTADAVTDLDALPLVELRVRAGVPKLRAPRAWLTPPPSSPLSPG